MTRFSGHFNPLGRKTETGHAQNITWNWHFNPLGRKTETNVGLVLLSVLTYFNPLGRKTETGRASSRHAQRIFQSTRSQDRDTPTNSPEQNQDISIHSVARPRRFPISNSRIIAIFQSTRSQDRDQYWNIRYNASIYFNPLGRKTETAKLNNY